MMNTTTSRSSSSSVLLLLLWKQYLTMRRNIKSTLVEIGIPILLIYGVCWMNSQTSGMIPTSHHPKNVITVPEQLNLNTQTFIPTIELLPAMLQAANMSLGLVASPPVIQRIEQYFPKTPFTPSLLSQITLFNSSSEIDSHILQYKSPQLYAALILDNTKVTVRLNASSSSNNDNMNSVNPATDIHSIMAAAQGSSSGNFPTSEIDGVLYQVLPIQSSSHHRKTTYIRAPGIIPLQNFANQLLRNSTNHGNDNCEYVEKLLKSAGIFHLKTLIPNVQECSADLVTSLFPHKSNHIMTKYFVQYPIPSHEKKNDGNKNPLEGSIIAYLIYAFLLPLTRFVRAIVLEKETKTREHLLMMGVPYKTLMASWIITYGIITLVIITIGAYKLQSVLLLNDFIQIWIYLLTFASSLFCFGYFVSTFFSRAKTATTMTPLLVFILSSPYVVGYKLTSHYNSYISLLKSLVPLSTTSNFSLGLSKGFFEEEYDFISTSMLFMVLDALLYITVGYVVEHHHIIISIVINRSSSYSRLSNTEKDKNSKYFEELSPEELRLVESNECISVSNLSKVYDDGKVAVNGIDLTMVCGEIFGLLGENGAGKSTTIGMLSGLIRSTSGTAFINGLDINTEMPVVRKSLGVCPQHDILFNDLTVREHIVFYASLKKVILNNNYIEKCIEEVNLSTKKDSIVSTLSGGQKRSLSVAIALIGDSSIVFLDEPTSGMDPYSRRSTWDLLQQKKKGRVIVLTTHSMDEADILSDRIGIMVKGQVRCIGSPLFLKNAYGVGYNLSITSTTTSNTSNNNAIVEMIMSHVASASVISNEEDDGVIVLRLPTDTSRYFKQMFNEVDTRSTELGIRNYGMSVTTVEEVFIKVVCDNTTTTSNTSNTSNTHHSPMQQRHVNDMTNTCSFITQVKVLLWKRYRVFITDKKGIISSFVIPLIFLAFILHSVASLNHISDDKVYQEEEEKSCVVMFSNEYYNETLEEHWESTTYSSSFVYNITSLSDAASYLLNHTKDSTTVATAAYYVDEESLNMFYNKTESIIPVEDQVVLENLKTFNDNIEYHLHVFPDSFIISETMSSIVVFSSSLSIMMTLSSVTSSFASLIVKEREILVKTLQFLSGVSITAYWVSNVIFDFVILSVVQMITLGLYRIYNNDSQVVPIGLLSLAFALYATSVLGFLYLASFIFKSASSAQSYLSYVNLSQILLFVLSYIASNIPIFCYKVHSYKSYFSLFPGYLLGDTILEVGTVKSAWWRKQCIEMSDGNSNMEGALQNLFTKSTTMSAWTVASGNIQSLALCSLTYLALVIGVDWIIGMPAVGKLVLDFVTRWFYKPLLVQKNEDEDDDEDVVREKKRDKKGDVVTLDSLCKVYYNEYKCISKRKKKNLVAVASSSFGLPPKTCFGFLGANGAGKSTTIKMLTGSVIPTSGTASLSGYNILFDQLAARRVMGYCCQENALFDNMTVTEHLILYGTLKGSSCTTEVSDIINRMDLKEFANVMSKNLSGGNKRKLQVGIAIIGNPRVLFLDEPSTGVDPVSKRLMWDLFTEKSSKNSAVVVLTTHSMEEAQAVCSVISIMVKGKLRCWGSAQHLKHRFGRGLLCEFKIGLNNSDDDDHQLNVRQDLLQQFLQQSFENIRKVEVHGQYVRYEIPRNDNTSSCSLGRVFGIIEEKRLEWEWIADYSVSQPSLDQIFNQFASQQSDDDNT